MSTRSHTPVIWLTGIPCSGKTTLAIELKKNLDLRNKVSLILDGDDIRNKLTNYNFSTEGRNSHISYIGTFASILSEQQIIPIVSLVSPNSSSRDFCRSLCSNFIEIYLSTSLEVCETRDVKGMYKKARSGEIQNFTGISGLYEKPLKPELEINTGEKSLEESLNLILFHLENNDYI